MSTKNQTPVFYPETGNLNHKDLKDSELVALHKTLFEKYIKRKIKKLDIRAAVLKLYEARIDSENIRLYYNHKISIFTSALVTDNLETIVKHQTFY